MAQWSGRSYFDWDWEACENDLLVILREAADLLAMSGDRTLTPHIVVATLVARLAMHRASRLDGRYLKRPLRFFDDAVTPPPVDESFAVIAAASTRKRQLCDEVVAELTKIMSPAIVEWALGDPENPDPREILRRTLELLWSKRLIPRPACDAYPRGI